MRARIRVEVDAELAVVRGWRAQSLALGAGLRPVFNGVAAGWTFDADRLGTFLAYCDHRHVWVEVVDLVPPPDDPPDDEQPTLFAA